jgi:nitrogen fixation NifU-like protein
MEGDVVADVRFVGEGCSISQASISMMTVRLKGRTREEAAALIERFTAMMHGDEAAARDRSLGDLRALAGVSRFPVRVKCALLGWNALEAALADE